MLEDVPRKDLEQSGVDYSLSPGMVHLPHLERMHHSCCFVVVGPRLSRIPLYYSLPIPGAQPLIGAFYFMEPANKALVQRTFGLLELEARTSNSKESKLARYGSSFTYDEFLVMPSVFRAVSFTLIFVTGFFLVAFVKPVRMCVDLCWKFL